MRAPTHRRDRIVAVCCLLLVSVRSAGADTLKALISDAANLKQQFDSAKRRKDQLAAVGQALSGNQLALRKANEALNSEVIVINKEGSEHDGQATTHNSQCSGVSSDTAFVAACNAEAAKLNNWKGDLEHRAKPLVEYHKKLLEEQGRLNNATLNWAAKTKSNNADFEVLNEAATAWRERYNALVFNSPTYKRLVETKTGAARCSRLAAADDLEAAQRCLQWLWDGSSKRP